MTTQTEQILTLAQWLSPAYPVGAFAYSHGLEWAVESRQVTSSESLKAWLQTVLSHGAGQADALLLAAAYSAEDPTRADAIARAFAASAERLKETVLQGEAFTRATADIWGVTLPSLTYPVAVGHAARQQGLPLDLTLTMYLQAFLSNLAAAGMRLVPLGQTEGQSLIKALTPLCIEIAAKAEAGSLEDLSSTAFMADIAAMKHETQYSRIFRT
ncbi:urease accessory protein UreF [Lentibacter algarum]|uniref:urease accessory protein UreF n=1 Tax=Lentibacter algarum TaxID=576131 RepID=UPI001C06A62D|nr:urease accessory UreF family protein [Lentibacter algarum]MBU2980791.1 urease accessory protein UreF [Lentibacter algarum]